ncbi:hypothetical protein Tco_1298435 [Tanacetum coccineum]
MEDKDQMFFKKLNEAEASEMIQDVTYDEIKIAMFNIDIDKAPGLDGYTSWKLLKEVNAALISLIPKINTPNKIKSGLEKVVSINQSAFIVGNKGFSSFYCWLKKLLLVKIKENSLSH